MTLTAGMHLGPYEIVSPLGAGGMGEVYRARDTKLGRDVAIKALPEEFARDRERLDRFEREARLLAQLNHAHIASLYGLEEHDGEQFLVMELVEGETLAEQIANGPIPLDEVLPLFSRIAEGLEAAHEKGIIHRDLKPANIKIAPDGKPKILDFGLAKAFAGEESDGKDSSQSPTLTKGTAMGAILGTASYMSPEQARGKAIDKRTDIFAFGCVLYEALTGERAFGGETVTDTLAAVVKSEPDWEALPAETPTRVRELLQRCLRKKTDRRFHDIADARIEIEEGSEPAPAPIVATRIPRAGLVFGGLALLLLGAIIGRGWVSSPVATNLPVMRASINLDEGVRFWVGQVAGVAISPDGTQLAYIGRVGGRNQIFLQSLDALEPRRIETPANAVMPFFSPDSRWLGFLSGRELKKVAASGGAPVTITVAEANFNPRGASWAPDDTIVFAPMGSGGLSRIAASGGEVEALIEPRRDAGEKGYRFPHVLPGGAAVLFTIARSDIESFDDAALAVLSLDTKEYRIVVEGGARGVYVDTGHLVYAHGSSLLAVAFDLATLSVEGAPVPVVDTVYTRPHFGAAAFAVSATGTLVYASGEAHTAQNRLLWVDRGGDSTPLARETRTFGFPSVAPDGRSLAIGVSGANDGLWTYDLERDTLSPLVTGFDNGLPIWSPDGSRIAFISNRTGRYSVYSVRADGTGSVDLLTAGDYDRVPEAFAPDGNTLLFRETHPETGADLWTLSLSGETEAKPLLQTDADESHANLSPDGRWLAYRSNESGQNEVYVQPFPGPGPRVQVSTDGGTNPIWNPAGGELFFRSRGRTMVVDVAGTDELVFGRPRVLFENPQTPDDWPFGIAPDGERFAMVFTEPIPQVGELRLVLNWTEELKRLVPTED